MDGLDNGGTGHGISLCRYDTNNDGDCARCHDQGGCVAVGGPFLAGRSCEETEASGNN